MITFSVLSDSAVKLTFDGNSHYLQDGEITVPKNSLALVKDESELITFIKAATGDAYLSFHIEDTNFANYTELENWYKANMVSAYGGGESSGISSGEVQTMIDNSISGKADVSAVTEAEQVLSQAINVLNHNKADISAFTAYSAATQTALDNKADISDLEDAEQVISQAINVLNNTKQNKLEYITEDTEGGFVDVNISNENEYYGATMGGGAITFITSNLNDESYTGNTLGETQIDINSTAINIINTTKTYDAVNQEWVEESSHQEIQSYEDGLYVDGEKIATVPMLNNKADVSAVTAAVSAVTPCVFDFGRAATIGITDDDWNRVMDAYQNNKPVIGILGTLRYACESLVLNTDADDHQVFQFTVSDGTSRYILDVTNLGNSNYQITRYDTIALPTTNDITNWNAKQDALIAGSGITISGNVISADGGGGVNSGEVQTMIDNSISGKVSNISLTSLNNKCEAIVQTKGSVTNYPICFSRINGESFAVFVQQQTKNFELVETSAITTSLTSSSTDSQVPSAKAVYDTLGGLKLVKLTQSEYDALVTKDPDTLYIITNVVNNS